MKIDGAALNSLQKEIKTATKEYYNISKEQLLSEVDKFSEQL
jgi:hypothetical protein